MTEEEKSLKQREKKQKSKKSYCPVAERNHRSACDWLLRRSVFADSVYCQMENAVY